MNHEGVVNVKSAVNRRDGHVPNKIFFGEVFFLVKRGNVSRVVK